MLMVYPVATGVRIDSTTVVFDIDWIGSERIVHLGTEHPQNLEPTLQGHSIGRWEGEVLVVDTVGFTAHAEGIGFAMPSSERKHLIERFALADDRRHLVYDVTIEDPVYLTEPVRYTAQWEYAPDLVPSGVECDLEIARRYLREAGSAISAVQHLRSLLSSAASAGARAARGRALRLEQARRATQPDRAQHRSKRCRDPVLRPRGPRTRPGSFRQGARESAARTSAAR